MKSKKTFWTLLSSFCMIVPAVFIFSACGHTHAFDDKWEKNEVGHWHVCTGKDCDEKTEIQAHVYDDDNDFVCNDCSFTRTPSANQIEYTLGARVYNGEAQGLVQGADFTINGTATITYKAKNSSDEFSSEAPKNAGTYIAKIEVAGNAIYAAFSEQKEFTIEQKVLSNIAVKTTYGSGLTATKTLTAENGVIGDDVVTLEIGVAADYTDEKGNEFANAGTKTPNLVSFVSNPNGNYKAPELSEISFVIEKVSLTFAETNSSLLKNGIYQGTQIPNVGVTPNENGDQTEPSTLLGTKIEKKDDSTWTAVSESEAVANAGHYRKVWSYSESKNYKATDFAIEFDVKPAEAISATDAISLIAGETKAYLVTFEAAQKFYNTGKKLGNAEVKIYEAGEYGVYDKEVQTNGVNNTIIKNGGKYIVLVTASEAVTSKPIFEDATFNGTYTKNLTVDDNALTVDGSAGKWLTFTFEAAEGMTYLLTYENISGLVYYSDSTNAFVECSADEGAMLSYESADTLTIYIYCISDLNEALITISEA